jgi:hypothetical protein
MGFQLRNDNNRAAHQGMLDLLRDAFNLKANVTFDYSIDLDAGKKNGNILRTYEIVRNCQKQRNVCIQVGADLSMWLLEDFN